MRKYNLHDIPKIRIKNNEAIIKCRNCGYFFVSSKDKIYCSNKCIKKKSKRESRGLRLRFKILQRDNFTCKYCGRNVKDNNVKLHVDHKIPISKGGSNNVDNLITSCSDCNIGKNDILLKP